MTDQKALFWSLGLTILCADETKRCLLTWLFFSLELDRWLKCNDICLSSVTSYRLWLSYWAALSWLSENQNKLNLNRCHYPWITYRSLEICWLFLRLEFWSVVIWFFLTRIIGNLHLDIDNLLCYLSLFPTLKLHKHLVKNSMVICFFLQEFLKVFFMVSVICISS